MGRRKLRMKQIEKEKTRGSTLRKRSQSLKKKAYEFSILCDVEVCMIIFNPKLNDSPSKVEVWPSDPHRVDSVIERYKHTMAASGSQKKTFCISDYFDLRRKQARDEVAQISKANFKAKFPTWDDRIDYFTPQQIASCLSKLDSNIEVVKRKIMLMKEDAKHKLLMQPESRSITLGGFDAARSRPSSSDNYIPAVSLHPWNRNLSDNHINAHLPSEIVNHFDHIRDFPRNNSMFGVTGEQHPLPAKPLDFQLPSLSPADEALLKLSLSLNPHKSLRMSMMNDFEVRSGNASSSNSGIPNNAMYDPPSSFSYCHDPRFGMTNNDVMFDPALIPVLHDPRSSAVQNNVMLKDPKAALGSSFYAPSMQMQSDQLSTYNNQQQLMIPHHVFHQMLPSDQFTTDFYNEINEHEMKNKKQRFSSQ